MNKERSIKRNSPGYKHQRNAAMSNKVAANRAKQHPVEQSQRDNEKAHDPIARDLRS